MLFVLVVVESHHWGVFLKISTDSQRRCLRWGFFLNKVLRRNSDAGVFFFFFVDLLDFWERLPCRARTTISVLFLDHYYH